MTSVPDFFYSVQLVWMQSHDTDLSKLAATSDCPLSALQSSACHCHVKPAKTCNLTFWLRYRLWWKQKGQVVFPVWEKKSMRAQQGNNDLILEGWLCEAACHVQHIHTHLSSNCSHSYTHFHACFSLHIVYTVTCSLWVLNSVFLTTECWTVFIAWSVIVNSSLSLIPI